MRAFRFRGARILDWRRVQLDAARVAFVRATESVREATARVADADAAIGQAASEYLGVLATPSEVSQLVRYQNWITQQRGRADASRKTLEERRLAADVVA